MPTSGRGRQPQADMDGPRAADLLAHLRRREIAVWVDGGWAVDALAGRQTRAHNDLDLVIRLEEVESVEREFAALGYERAGGEPPMSFESVAADGRQVDSHPIAADGTYLLRDGSTWRYPLPERQARGTIGGREVRCLDAGMQIVCHDGYEKTDKDHHDLALLEALAR